jgi:hypothetical protein
MMGNEHSRTAYGGDGVLAETDSPMGRQIAAASHQARHWQPAELVANVVGVCLVTARQKVAFCCQTVRALGGLFARVTAPPFRPRGSSSS